MFDSVRTHETALWWLGALSVATFLGTLVVIPMLVVRIPEDYFLREKRRPSGCARQHAFLRLAILVARQVFGILFVAAGIAMLILPGQGVLTILVGVMLMSFPGKYALERWMIQRAPVDRVIHWLRTRAGRPALQMPEGRRARGQGRVRGASARGEG